MNKEDGIEQTFKERVRAYELFVTGEREWLPYDIPLERLGPFCNIFLPNIVTLIRNSRNQQENFEVILGLAKNNINNLLNMLDEESELKQIVKDTVKILDLPKEEIGSRLEDIASPLYTLFYLRLKRAQVSLHFLSDGKARSVYKTPVKAIENYIQQVLPRCRPDSASEPAPLLLDIREGERLKHHLSSQNEDIPLCPCGCLPKYFAMPCQCPIGCERCYEPITDLNCCPECLNPIEEIVEVVY